MSWSHKLVLGVTGYGKSTIIRRIIAKGWDQSPRVASLVLDPNLEGDWGDGAHFVTDDPVEYLQVAKESKCCILVVDEAGEMLKRDPEFRWLVTRSRHFGHIAVLSSHFATDILPVMRNQCQEAYVFKQNLDAAKTLARQYADQLFARAHQLDVGQYIHKVGTDIARIKMLNLDARPVRK